MVSPAADSTVEPSAVVDSMVVAAEGANHL